MRIQQVFFLLIVLSTCTPNKRLEVWGFAYGNEQISIKGTKDNILTFTVVGKGDSKGVCSFHEEAALPLRRIDSILMVSIDSSGIRLLDTLVNISSANKEPFISIEYPNRDNVFRRSLFLRDASDPMYIKD